MSRESKQRVFLCHNSRNKKEVRKVCNHLENRLQITNIYPYMDDKDFEPFKPWEEQLIRVMKEQTVAAAIFFGSSGLGSYQVKEINSLLENKQFHRMGLVILPSCSIETTHSLDLQPELKKRHWVDFHEEEFDPVEKLIWGITGDCPETISINELEQKQLTDEAYQSRLKVHRDNLALTTELFEIAEKNANEKLSRLKQELDAAKARKALLDEELANLESDLRQRLSESLRGIVNWLECEREQLALLAGDKAQQELDQRIVGDVDKGMFYFSIETLIKRVSNYFTDPVRDPIFLSKLSILHLPPEAPKFIVDLYILALKNIIDRVQKSPYSLNSKQEVNDCIEELIKALEVYR